MKIASYRYKGRESFGVVTDGGICDVPARWSDGPAGLLEALRQGPEALRNIKDIAEASLEAIPAESVQLLAPIPNPPKLIALAFLMPSTAVAAPGAEIAWPCYSRTIDYEIELAIIIGSRCKCVSAAEAARHIVGYTIANDVSARSTTWVQGRAGRPWDEFYDWMCGKWSDGFCPWIWSFPSTARSARRPTRRR